MFCFLSFMLKPQIIWIDLLFYNPNKDWVPSFPCIWWNYKSCFHQWVIFSFRKSCTYYSSSLKTLWLTVKRRFHQFIFKCQWPVKKVKELNIHLVIWIKWLYTVHETRHQDKIQGSGSSSATKSGQVYDVLSG